jgi:hypothetical protein
MMPALIDGVLALLRGQLAEVHVAQTRSNQAFALFARVTAVLLGAALSAAGGVMAALYATGAGP